MYKPSALSKLSRHIWLSPKSWATSIPVWFWGQMCQPQYCLASTSFALPHSPNPVLTPPVLISTHTVSLILIQTEHPLGRQPHLMTLTTMHKQSIHTNAMPWTWTWLSTSLCLSPTLSCPFDNKIGLWKGHSRALSSTHMNSKKYQYHLGRDQVWL